jgi:Holliday junction resolvase RusA-like endonuclease
MQRFEVTGRIPTLNWYRNAHFYQLNKSKKDWQKLICEAIQSAKIKEVNTPLTIHLTTYTKRKRDVDGTIVGVKYIQDAMVEMGLIPDDTPEYVETIILNWKKATGEEKIVCILQ